MNFEQGHLYHIYNQGNNRQRIFFCQENYLFFLNKIRNHVLPFADILAWCLMPNHFHLMVYTRDTQGLTPSQTLSGEEEQPFTQGLTPRQTLSGEEEQPFTQGLTLSQTLSGEKNQSFNHSIGVMLRSYTRAINKQENTAGALFRQQTKANCLTRNDQITRAWFTSQGITQINVDNPEKQYPNICFNYINFNPLKDGLVKKIEDWEFSSYPDIVGLRNGKLINRSRIKEFGLSFYSD